MIPHSDKLTIKDKVLLDSGEKCKLVQLCDIRFFETYGNYSRAYFNGGMLLINRTLNYLDDRLSKRSFFRANRQFIVNLSHIEGVRYAKNSMLIISMSCGKEITISRRRSQMFRETLAI